MVESIIKVLE